MKPLYLADSVREVLGKSLRPGGETLTRRMVSLVRPATGDLLLDAGCGAGASMMLLRESDTCRVVGIDFDQGLTAEARNSGLNVAQADMAQLPLLSDTVDTVLCECAWNLTNKQQALAEFFRVLRPGGLLALSDIYLRHLEGQQCKRAWPNRSCFFQATDLETVRGMVSRAGFEILQLEDHSQLLKKTAAEFVFAHGSLQGFWEAVMGDSKQAKAACTASAAARPGLFLLIGKRKKA
ncbi:DVU_1556 family methyltransferase [Desulfogranum marinum]|uniref:DVU_1556 family methyltransferase n=1 Tax=Desulfogranum marinum TaxID=453220 RepID=UPI0029C838FF|nr:class I SAM-dependent methyltransferase [Desulfogranum marinum]